LCQQVLAGGQQAPLGHGILLLSQQFASHSGLDIERLPVVPILVPPLRQAVAEQAKGGLPNRVVHGPVAQRQHDLDEVRLALVETPRHGQAQPAEFAPRQRVDVADLLRSCQLPPPGAAS
jgi:hypothetical protein